MIVTYMHAPRKQNSVDKTDDNIHAAAQNTKAAPCNNLNQRNKRRHDLNGDGYIAGTVG